MCPSDKPYVYSKDGLCYDYDRDCRDAMKKKAGIAGLVFAILAILIIIVIWGAYLLKAREKNQNEKELRPPEILEYDKNSIKRPIMNQIHS